MYGMPYRCVSFAFPCLGAFVLPSKDCTVFCARDASSVSDDAVYRSECDSPFTLTNYTLDFLEQEWASEIDFVVCECP